MQAAVYERSSLLRIIHPCRRSAAAVWREEGGELITAIASHAHALQQDVRSAARPEELQKLQPAQQRG